MQKSKISDFLIADAGEVLTIEKLGEKHRKSLSDFDCGHEDITENMKLYEKFGFIPLTTTMGDRETMPMYMRLP